MFLLDFILRRGCTSRGSKRTVELTGNFSCLVWRRTTSSLCVCVGSPVGCYWPQCSGFKHMRQTTRSPDTSNITQGWKLALFQPNSFTVKQGFPILGSGATWGTLICIWGHRRLVNRLIILFWFGLGLGLIEVQCIHTAQWFLACSKLLLITYCVVQWCYYVYQGNDVTGRC